MCLTHTHKHKHTLMHSQHRIELLLTLGNSFHGNGKQRGLTTSHTALLRSRVSAPKSTEKSMCVCEHAHTHTCAHTYAQDLYLFVRTLVDIMHPPPALTQSLILTLILMPS